MHGKLQKALDQGQYLSVVLFQNSAEFQPRLVPMRWPKMAPRASCAPKCAMSPLTTERTLLITWNTCGV